MASVCADHVTGANRIDFSRIAIANLRGHAFGILLEGNHLRSEAKLGA